jgi:hypothetical protein
MVASRLSAAATIKTIVNSVAHMVDAPRFPDTDLKAAHQLQQKYGTHFDTRGALLPFYSLTKLKTSFETRQEAKSHAVHSPIVAWPVGHK